jgi:hypothetical protein
MPDTLTLAVLLLLAAFLVLAVLLVARWMHRRRLRQRFGSEYDRAVEAAGDRRLAERDLQSRLHHFDKLELRELSTAERRDLAARWRAIQVEFVDDPEDAVETADRLVTEAMRLRGYPAGSFEERVAGASVQVPELADDYREARRIAEINRRKAATTEELRQSMVHYRAIFQGLLGIDEAGPIAGTGSAASGRQIRR